jgi:mRNA interferase MazF
MYECGTIVLIPFPFTDLSFAKVRPGLIVSKKSTGDDVIVCFITSKMPHPPSSGLILEPDARNGLKSKSVVRFEKIATLSKRLILGEVGNVEKEILHTHAMQLHGVFGF